MTNMWFVTEEPVLFNLESGTVVCVGPYIEVGRRQVNMNGIPIFFSEDLAGANEFILFLAEQVRAAIVRHETKVVEKEKGENNDPQY